MRKASKDDSSDSDSESDESVQLIENVTAKTKVQATNVRSPVVSKNLGPPAMPAGYHQRLAQLKVRFDQAKAARKQRNTEAMEEASFLEKVTRLELQEKARMEGTESESQESNESLMDIDE